MTGELDKVSELVRRSRAASARPTASSATSCRQTRRHTQTLVRDTRIRSGRRSPSTKARGQWGERMAEDVLRLAGFVEGVNYRKRQALAGRAAVPTTRSSCRTACRCTWT